MEKNSSKLLCIENIFVFVCLFWGLLFAVLTSPFQAPDEPEHFFKMWGFTQGTLKYQLKDNWVGVYAPKNLVEIYKIYNQYRWTYKKIPTEVNFYMSKVPLDRQDKVFFKYNAPEYTPLSYFPSFLVLWVLKLLNVAPLVMTYLLRVSFLLTYIALGYVALKIIPCKKWMLFLVQTLPIVLSQSASINTDAIFFGIVFIFFAYTLKLAFDENIKKIDKKEIVIWGILGVLVSILKFAYAPLLLFYFIIPKEKFENTKNYYKNFLFVLILQLLVLFLFSYCVMSKDVYRSEYYGINTKTSIIFWEMIKHPFEHLYGILYTTVMYIRMNFYYTNTISSIGTTFTTIPLFATNLYWFLLILSGVYSPLGEKKYFTNWKNNLIITVSLVFVYCMIVTSIYLVYQHYPFMRGMQGRYLTPLLPFLLLLLSFKNFRLENKIIPACIFVVSQFLLGVTLICYVVKFY